MEKKLITKSPKESFDLGKQVGMKLSGGEVLALNGDLGSGKTTFLQGLAKGLGVLHKVNSPTFNILKIYKTKKGSTVKRFCHIDTYRLNSSQELINIGFNDLLNQADLVIAIEWADKVKSILPKKRLDISFEHKAIKQKIKTVSSTLDLNQVRSIKINFLKNNL